MFKAAAGLVFGIALMTPLFGQTVRVEDRRYYDRQHKDYHVWNEGERNAYGRYQAEQRAEQRREWQRNNAQQQRQYWIWRHLHADVVVVPERR